MSAEQASRVTVSVVIAAIAVVLLVWATPSHPFKPKGIILPAAKVRKPTAASAVAIFMNPPQNSQKLGTIQIEMHYGSKSRVAEKAIMQFARRLAATVGANGIVIKRFGHTITGSVPAAQAMYAFTGEAIYTTDTQAFSALSLGSDNL
jgi:hypothetical protein